VQALTNKVVAAFFNEDDLVAILEESAVAALIVKRNMSGNSIDYSKNSLSTSNTSKLNRNKLFPLNSSI